MGKKNKTDEAGLPFYLRSDYVDWRREYREKCMILGESFVETGCVDFYRDLFPPESIESCWDDHKPNPILTYCDHLKTDGSPGMRNEVIYNDYQNLALIPDNQFALMGMCTYSGASPKGDHAYRCHGFCIDLDDVTGQNLQNVLHMAFEAKLIPVPQYIAVSGAGIHVYYVFEDPVPLYSQNREALNRLKLGLSRLLWNPQTTRKLTDCETMDEYGAAFQYQNIYQRYRAVGSKSKLAWKTKLKRKSKYVIRAYRISSKKTCVEELNHYVDDAYRAGIKEMGTTMQEAKKLWPEWFQRRIVEHQAPGTYLQTRGLFGWWLKILDETARQGNRYYCLAILFAMAKKTGVPYSEAYQTAEALIGVLDERTEPGQEHFGRKDLDCASGFYNDRSFRLSNWFIYMKTGYQVAGSVKRNGRSRKEHMQYMSECRKRASYEHVGRPKGSGKQEIIRKWQELHPDGSKAECIRETGLSKPTVYKWWRLERQVSRQATAEVTQTKQMDIRNHDKILYTQYQRMHRYYELLWKNAG